MNKPLNPGNKAIPGFEGRFYNKLPHQNWGPHIPIPSGPINYLEIGVADGGNAILVSKSYAKDPESRIYCVDPWIDYDEYPEYKGQQELGYKTFLSNIQKCTNTSKFIVNRGMSDVIVPTFADNFFDIIFVDGNHETEYVYRDGIMAFQKLKVGGYIVFDDYNDIWKQTMAGIDKFIAQYKDNLDVIYDGQLTFGQIIVRRKL
jgi:hypothetical protein